MEPSGINTPNNSVGKPDTLVPTEPTLVSAPTPHAPWSRAVRMAFRIALLYFFCFVVVGANDALLQVNDDEGGDWVEFRERHGISLSSEVFMRLASDCEVARGRHLQDYACG